MRSVASREEAMIFSTISSYDGIKARQIAKKTGIQKSVINRLLYASPYMKDLCYCDKDFYWYGLIRQTSPHIGIGDFSGYYGTVGEFMSLDEDAWLEMLCEGCRQIGRNLNDTRGLFHSFRDTRSVMRQLFFDLENVEFDNWELIFELRIRRSKMIRIYADVLLITEDKVFSLEFKMKDRMEPEEVAQAAKYVPFLEVLFGPKYDVIAALVLTQAEDVYTYVPLEGTTAEIPVCSGDMLFNVLDEYMGFLEE